ncbi:MAG: hypothetical protein Q8O53_01790 [Candidatus Moranbacteria bacterium]|nr:hypothetical protein [Candidatus Moranbacteria bacterium]
MKNKKIYITFFILITLVVIFVSIFFAQQFMKNKIARENAIPHIQDLADIDPDFNKSIQIIDNSGELIDTVPLLRASLEKQRGTKYEVFPKLLLATSLGWVAYLLDENDPQANQYLRESISLLKEIVAHPSNPIYINSKKATALQAMERLSFTYRGPTIQALLIETEPYKSFDTDGTLRTFQKNLLSYSESLYPIAGVETRLASLYARDMAEYVQNAAQDTTLKLKIETQKNTVQKLITQGDVSIKELEGLKAYPLFTKDIPETLLFKAIAAQYYFEATGESPFGNIETLYKKAIASAEEINPKKIPGLHLYYYASYLSTLNDPARYDEIKSLLKRNYTQENYLERTAGKGLFATEKNNILGEKQNIIRLAKIDSDFKEILVKLGWTEADFKQTP